MKALGDITKINGTAAPRADVIIGGSPCQDLSAAGNQKGLTGERSGLFMEQIRIIREMREADKRDGRADVDVRPRYMVWENVLGAFSSPKSDPGEDFRIVLEETARIVCPAAAVPRPAGGEWRNSGAILGDGRSIVWRVLDAQFWGVPQRRRRIALVADFGGESAPEILFERKGVPGDIEPRGAEGQETAEDAGDHAALADSAIPGDQEGVHGEVAGFNGWRSVTGSVEYAAERAPCLNSTMPPEVIQPSVFNESGPGYWMEGCGCLRAEGENRPSRPGHIAVSFMAGQGAKAGGIAYGENVAPTLKASPSGLNMAPTIVYVCRTAQTGSNGMGVSEEAAHTLDQSGAQAVVCIAGNTIGRQDHNGADGAGALEDTSYTLNTRDVHAVAVWPEINGTLMARHDSSPQAGQISNICCVATGQAGAEILEEASPTLNRNHEQPYIAGAGMIVRRLTPLECERLQGFPDGWTNIPGASDSARYAALGNSIALPPWRYVLRRLCAQYDRPATMASLFDGIGGFPLIWQEINGPGSALWASEIEEFALRVTELRFSG